MNDKAEKEAKIRTDLMKTHNKSTLADMLIAKGNELVDMESHLDAKDQLIRIFRLQLVSFKETRDKIATQLYALASRLDEEDKRDLRHISSFLGDGNKYWLKDIRITPLLTHILDFKGND